MNQEKISIRRALISVSDKTGILDFAQFLVSRNVEIISTGGTAALLAKNNIPVTHVENITKFPEMMDGRVKTLHPKIHGGILGQRDKHEQVAQAHDIQWIDLIIVNLYPFQQTVQSSTITIDGAIEQIDIGGPTLIRGAAKNMEWVCVVVDPADYSNLTEEIEIYHGISFETRKKFAKKSFMHTANYDRAIYEFFEFSDFNERQNKSQLVFPDILNLNFQKVSTLRYGENPHQLACAYKFSALSGILSAKQYQGKELSYNNIADADAAVTCVNEFMEPAAVIVKHGNPCGVALGKNILEAFEYAYAADALSAFGGIVALNRHCDAQLAQMIHDIFFEVIIAPSYSEDAIKIFRQKTKLRILENTLDPTTQKQWQYKFVRGGMLLQEADIDPLQKESLQVATKFKPSEQALQSMLFAWPVVKHLKSNAVLLAKDHRTIGIGSGQVSRIDAVDIALKKAGDALNGSVLASDAFFPFRDSIDRLAKTGIVGIIQPGGSVRDKDVIAACDEYGIPMVFTGKRCFNH